MSELLSPEIEQETTLLIGVVCLRGDRVLLMKKIDETEEERIKYIYSLPFSKANSIEDPIVTAQKTLTEQTGLKVEQENLIHDPDKLYIADREKKDSVIKKTALQTFVTIKVEGDLIEQFDTIPEWILISKLDNHHLLPNTKQAIVDALQLIRKELKYDSLRSTNS